MQRVNSTHSETCLWAIRKTQYITDNTAYHDVLNHHKMIQNSQVNFTTAWSPSSSVPVRV